MEEYKLIFLKNDKNSPFNIEMCGISYCDGTYKINRTNSKIWCIEYVYKGIGYIKCGTAEFAPESGDVYILPAGLDHYYYSDSQNSWEKIWFNVNGDFVEKTFEAYGLKNVYHIKNVDVALLFEDFIKSAEFIKKNGEDEVDFDICAEIFLKIIQKLSKNMRREATYAEYTMAEKLKKRIDSITDFSSGYDEILKDFHYTKSHLIRIFKKEYNCTPYEYYLEKKITVSKMLMRNTAMSIQEISACLGFNDSHYFSNFFKKRTGMAPKNYREPSGNNRLSKNSKFGYNQIEQIALN